MILIVSMYKTFGSAMENCLFPIVKPLVSGFRTNGFVMENF